MASHHQSDTLSANNPLDDSPLVPTIYGSRLHGRKIRLLRLRADSTRHTLHCDLHEHDLDRGTDFQAISYTWGDPTPNHIITCNGVKIGITECLHDILYQFREDRNYGWLWTDALCINQADLAEKTQQVKVMGDIYSAATEVLVWLGKEEPTDLAAIELLASIYEMFGLPSTLAQMTGRHDPTLGTLQIPDSSDVRWSYVRRILRRPWFRRVWTVQEFLLAKRSRARLGRLIIDWNLLFCPAINLRLHSGLLTVLLGPDDLRAAIKNIQQMFYFKNTHSPFLFQGKNVMPASESTYLTRAVGSALTFLSTKLFEAASLFSKVQMPAKDSTKPPLVHLLQATANRDATIAQDRVFAVLALAQDGRLDMIDYQKDIADVYIDAAKMGLGVVDDHHIPLGVSLQLLLNIERASTVPGLPSWVPDYRVRWDFSAMERPASNVVSYRHPSLNNVRGFCDGKILQLSGRFIDSLIYVVDDDAHEARIHDFTKTEAPPTQAQFVKICFTEEKMLKAPEYVENCLLVAEMLGVHPTGEPIRDALVATLVCGSAKTGSLEPFLRNGFENYVEMITLLKLLPHFPSSSLPNVGPAGPPAIRQTLQAKDTDAMKLISGVLGDEPYKTRKEMNILKASLEKNSKEIDIVMQEKRSLHVRKNSMAATRSSVTDSVTPTSDVSALVAEMKSLMAVRETLVPKLEHFVADTSAASSRVAMSEDIAQQELEECYPTTNSNFTSAEAIQTGKEVAEFALVSGSALVDPKSHPILDELRQLFDNRHNSMCNTSEADSNIIHPMETPITLELLENVGSKVPSIVRAAPGNFLLGYLFELSLKVKDFEQRFNNFSYGRRFGVTFDKYMGWFPSEAKRGDIIVVFNGSTIPFVVRKSLDDAGKWDGMFTFVGACFVHGYMDGGAWAFDREEVHISMK